MDRIVRPAEAAGQKHLTLADDTNADGFADRLKQRLKRPAKLVLWPAVAQGAGLLLDRIPKRSERAQSLLLFIHRGIPDK